MYENRRITTRTARTYSEVLGREAEDMYVDGVMLFNKLRREGYEGPYLEVLEEHLDRMDKLVAVGGATAEMLQGSILSLDAKVDSVKEYYDV